ncbi:4-galactosyl-N-acetylglucosaminide 3-alpha-L-fucosyltransferase 9-like [Trichomycterus rosablanca]|uniref:4-galactosyl-N-acetylglucosaminide 3-alpha-L-fucosyltransferase 9-like n=1 Tax=Trichomycterus rosablanca TaxID=2290929 RepID=UPI002F35DD43
MMSTAGSSQYLLLAVFLLLCFGATFYTYYKPTVSWFSCPDVPPSTPEVCTRKCLAALNLENFTSSVNTSFSSLIQQTLTKEAEEEKQSHGSDTIILIWAWPFGFKFRAESCSQFGVTGCVFIDDRTQYDKAHGVMFHLRDIHGDLPRLLEMPRPPGQKWAWLNMESPDNSSPLPGADNLFNLTTNFRRDSDVWVPYGKIVEASEEDKAFQIPAKDKLVCWIVSNWSERFRRVQYFTQLSKHIQVEAYGRHFSRYIEDKDYQHILPSCKFYLAFENSVYKDYLTEKLFNPLKAGTVPVVLGPPRENYEEFLPADSFIHVDDFPSPRELAERLKFLDQNQEEYERYFSWRKHYMAQETVFGLENACRVCDHVKRHKEYRVFKNLNKWYWGRS